MTWRNAGTKQTLSESLSPIEGIFWQAMREGKRLPFGPELSAEKAWRAVKKSAPGMIIGLKTRRAGLGGARMKALPVKGVKGVARRGFLPLGHRDGRDAAPQPTRTAAEDLASPPRAVVNRRGAEFPTRRRLPACPTA